jgi:two-component system, LytTR family, sensor kinase
MTSHGIRTSRVVVLAFIVGSLFTAEAILSDLAAGRAVSVAPLIVVALLFWVVWAFLTPAVLALLRRWPLDARPVARSLLVHVAVSPLLAAAQTLLALGLRSLALYAWGTIGAREALAEIGSRPTLVWGVFTGIFFYWLIAILYTALRFRENAAALETALSRSALDALRSQLRPHFLFNTLNAISGLVSDDTEAHRMLLRLSSLLRRSLDEQAHEVSLEQELAFLNDYLDIQRVRFGDRLVVELEVDQSLLETKVPVFLLQPLLENAIEHGGSEDGSATVVLRATRDNETLRIVLDDLGPGFGGPMPVREGIGLSNTRARLRHLYGPRATVDLEAAEVGTRVVVRLPLDARRP